MRTGLSACSAFCGPFGSHQRLASAANLSSSDWRKLLPFGPGPGAVEAFMRTSWPCRSALGRDRHYTRKFPSRPSAPLQRRAVDGGDSGATLFRVGDECVDVLAGQLSGAQLRLAGDPHVADLVAAAGVDQ